MLEKQNGKVVNWIRVITTDKHYTVNVDPSVSTLTVLYGENVMEEEMWK